MSRNGFWSSVCGVLVGLLLVGVLSTTYQKIKDREESSSIESVESIESGEEDESSPTSKDDEESATLPGTSEEDKESSSTPNTSEEDNESASSPGGSIVSPDDTLTECNHKFSYNILSYGESCEDDVQMISYCKYEGCNGVKVTTGKTDGNHSYDENGVCTVCGDGMTGACTGEHYFNLKYAVDIELPTCTESGTITYECTNEHCHQTKTETLAPWGHKYGEDGICTSCGEQQPTESGGETVNAELVVAWNEAWEPEDAFFWADGFVE